MLLNINVLYTLHCSNSVVRMDIFSSQSWIRCQVMSLVQAFFITSAAEKTKTQAENSSQKLKEKTQSHGGTFYILQKNSRKKLNLFFRFLPVKKSSRKKLNFKNFSQDSQETEGVRPIMLFLLSSIFKISTF